MTLIERLERGPGSRELSDECLLAAGWRSVPSALKDWSDIYLMPNGDAWNMRTMGNRPDPSQNLQDALDWMVPEGWGATIKCAPEGHGFARLYDSTPYPNVKKVGPVEAATPALALCAASRRAREAMKETEDG